MRGEEGERERGKKGERTREQEESLFFRHPVFLSSGLPPLPEPEPLGSSQGW